MGEITDRFDATMNNVVPLAMKKWALDMENDKWNQQLAEAKRQHSLNAGLKFLESGDFTNAEIFLKDALPGLNAGSLSQSPMALLKAAEVKAKQRQFDIDEDVGNRLKAMTQPRQVTVADLDNATGDMDRGFGATGNEANILPAPTKDITVSGRTPTLQDLIDVRAAAGDSSAAFLKALTTQAGMESLMEKLKMQNEHNRAVEAIMSRNADSKNILALAAMMRAEKSGSDAGLVKAIDENGEVIYVPKSEAAGKRASTGITKKQLADAEAKIIEKKTNKEDAAPYVDLYNQANTGSKYEWEPGMLYGGKWVKKPASGSVSRPAAANAGAAGVIKWGRDANGNPVRIK